MRSRRNLLALLPASLLAQGHPEYNYDETKAGPYRLPNPLAMQDGKVILSARYLFPLYIGTADGHQGADPRGGLLAAKAATPVYELFGKSL